MVFEKNHDEKMNTPLSSSNVDKTSDIPGDQHINPSSESIKMLQRTRSQEMVEDHHNHIVDEDPLLISQSLTYVTDDGSTLHTFRSSPFSMGKCEIHRLFDRFPVFPSRASNLFFRFFKNKNDGAVWQN